MSRPISPSPVETVQPSELGRTSNMPIMQIMRAAILGADVRHLVTEGGGRHMGGNLADFWVTKLKLQL